MYREIVIDHRFHDLDILFNEYQSTMENDFQLQVINLWFGEVSKVVFS